LISIGGSDYIEVNSHVEIFPINSSNGDERCINILVLDDAIVENSQSFFVVLSTMDSYANTRNRKIEITINDNDCKFRSCTFINILPALLFDI